MKSSSDKTAESKGTGIVRESDADMPLFRNNFLIMAIAGVMIVVGFLLMLGSGSSHDAFNPDIFSTRRIVVGPAITFLGFILMGVGIIVKPRRK